MSNKDARFLSKVACWYYNDDLNQEEIARRTRLSRSTVSRLLRRARKEGIVSITVNFPDATESSLEQRLEEVFHLKEAVVASSNYSQDLMALLGRAAAAYLQRAIQPGDNVGIAWGHTLWHTVTSMRGTTIRDVSCVQLTGGVGNSSNRIDASEHVRTLAARIGGKPYVLHAPFHVDSEEVLHTIGAVPVIAEVLEKMKHLNMAVVSLGSLDADAGLIRHSVFPPEAVRTAAAMGAVGEMCGRLYDDQGNLDIRLPGKVPFGISLEELQQVDHVVGVAGGMSKVPAILAALKNGLINVLITDSPTAEALVARVKQR